MQVVGYTDDDDMDVRFAWNVAKHDEENNTVRWSTVGDKIGVPTRLHKRHGCWTKVQDHLKLLYGPVKRTDIGRWIRAAKGMHPEVAADLANYPKLPANAIWDNEYMLLKHVSSRSKLTVKGAKAVLASWNAACALNEKVSASLFINTMCKGMRLLEVWHIMAVKRFGSIAVNSKALQRLMEKLGSFTGLQTVIHNSEAGFALNGKSAEQPGIPECFLLFQELEKCKAGGLPPPDTIPTEIEARRREDAAHAAALEEQRKCVEAEKKKMAELAAELAAAEDLDPGLFLRGASSAPSAGCEVHRTREKEIKDVMDARLENVHFEDTPAGLLSAAQVALSTQPRVVVVVEAHTSDIASFTQLLDLAHQIWQQYEQGHGCGPGPDRQFKFRIIVLLGTRFDLLAKASSKATTLWPRWSKMLVQLQARDWQTSRHRPGVALVLCPSREVHKTREPVCVNLAPISKSVISAQSLLVRCADEQCPWREKQADIAPSAGKGDPNLAAIDAADQVDAFADAMAQLSDDDGEELAGVSTADSKGQQLWPFAHAQQYYEQVLEALGAASRAQVAFVISASAHPNHWLACLEYFKLDTYVLTRKWSNHSTQHGITLGKASIFSKLMSTAKVPSTSDNSADTQQFVEVDVVPGTQTIEAYDVHQGDKLNDGLNQLIPAQAMESHSAKVLKAEEEVYKLRVSQESGGGERFLETMVALKNGDTVCEASCLFFDVYQNLQDFLNMPGNNPWRGKVAKMDGVMKEGVPRTIWAPLFGAVRFCSHFRGKRKRPNCILEFVPSKGFNQGSLVLKVCTKEGVGGNISAGSPLLLDFGASFSFEAARLLADDGDATFNGALDIIFRSQKLHLEDEVVEHETQVALDAQAALAEAAKAEVEAAAKAEAEKTKQEDDAKRRKIAEETEDKKKSVEALKKAKALEVAGDEHPAKKPRLAGSVVYTSEPHGFELLVKELCVTLQNPACLTLRNQRAQNTKLAKDCVLGTWSHDTRVCRDKPGFEYSWSMNTFIFDKALNKVMRMDKYIKEVHPETTKIYKYMDFPGGQLPKMLAQDVFKNW